METTEEHIARIDRRLELLEAALAKLIMEVDARNEK